MNNKEYFYKQQKIWRKEQLRPSAKDLLIMFPRAKEIVKERLKEEIKINKTQLCKIKKVLNKMRYRKDFWFVEEFVKAFFLPDLLKNEKMIAKHRMFLNSLQGDGNQIDFQVKLEKARGYPILQLAEKELVLQKIGNKYRSLCPFHKEKTASFYLYPESNSYYCFGCQTGSSDPISLAMQLHNLDFRSAVSLLSQ